MSKITSMKRLRKEKQRLEQLIETQKAEIIVEAENLKNALWPVRLLKRLQHTLETLAENKFVAVGAQLAYAALHAIREGKKGEEGKESDHPVVEFLKRAAQNFLEMYMKKEE
ncbi:MAG TPA: hypothetical protein VFU15_06430 [Bacteroidia bacterium]|nr:hypothetical protein [Bacteroidia bacterium]